MRKGWHDQLKDEKHTYDQHAAEAFRLSMECSGYIIKRLGEIEVVTYEEKKQVTIFETTDNEA